MNKQQKENQGIHEENSPRSKTSPGLKREKETTSKEASHLEIVLEYN